MSPDPKVSSQYDVYLGRKDLVLYIEQMMQALFPTTAASVASSSADQESALPPLSEWLAYVFYRTALPNSTVFHALHLLRRVAAIPSRARSFQSPLFSPSQPHNLAHFSLMVAALILANNYSQEDAYSTRSWSVACRELFVIGEIDDLQLDLLRVLGWRLRDEGEDLAEVLAEDEAEWKEIVEMEAARSEQEQMKIKLAKTSTKTAATIPVVSTHSCQPTKPSTVTGEDVTSYPRRGTTIVTGGSPQRRHRSGRTARYNPLERTSSPKGVVVPTRS